MKSPTRPIVLGCSIVFIAGAALNFILPHQHSPTDAAAQAKTTAEKSALPPGRKVSAALEESLRNGTGSKRWLQLLSTLENARPEDIPGLLKIASNDPAMIRMLAARWAELDPDHMFRSLYADYMLPEGSPGSLPSRYTLGDVLFEEWAKSDPKAAIKALTDVPDFTGREQLRMTVSNRLMQADVEAGLRALKDWSVQHYIPDMRKVGEWAAKDPQHAAETILELGGSSPLTEGLKEVGKAWAKGDAASGLRFAAGLTATQRSALGGEIMRNWAERDLQSAVDFATKEADPALRAAVAQGLVASWGKTDPAAALAWSEENLHGAIRAETVAGLVKSVAEKDLDRAADLAAEMQPGTAQSKACASIFETWFKKGPDQRDAAFAWLAALPDAEAQRAALDRVQWDWVWRDPDSVKDFISGPYGKLASSNLISQVARNQAARNPATAMEWARSLPPEQAPEARRAVFDSWLSVRPQNAADYASNLPSGPERENAIRSVSQTLVYQSPKQAADWFRKLPAEDQKTVQDVFRSVGLPSDRRQELDDALKGL